MGGPQAAQRARRGQNAAVVVMPRIWWSGVPHGRTAPPQRQARTRCSSPWPRRPRRSRSRWCGSETAARTTPLPALHCSIHLRVSPYAAVSPASYSVSSDQTNPSSPGASWPLAFGAATGLDEHPVHTPGSHRSRPPRRPVVSGRLAVTEQARWFPAVRGLAAGWHGHQSPVPGCGGGVTGALEGDEAQGGADLGSRRARGWVSSPPPCRPSHW